MPERGATIVDALRPRHLSPRGEEPHLSRPDRARRVVAGLAVVAVGAGLATALLTGSVVLIVLSVIITTTLALARSVGWRVAVAISLLGAMVAEGCLVRVTPYLPWGLAVSDLALWAVVGLLGVAALLLRGTPMLTRAQGEMLVFAMVVPIVGAVGFLAKYVASGGTWIAWAMSNDVAFRSLMARWSLEDDGLVVGRGFNDPLISALLAAWSARPADSRGVGDMMWAIVHSGAQISILLWLAVSFITSVIALRAAPLGRGYRLCVAVAAGLLPWTWFVSESAFDLGFQNVAPAVLVMLLTWLLWSQRDRQPVACLAGLLLATLAAAMAWAPLAALPLGWAVHTAVQSPSALRRASWRARMLPTASLGLGLAYAATVTVPEARRVGLGALATNGAIEPVNWRWALGLATVGLAASLMFRRRLSPNHRWGIWCAVVSCGLAMGLLLYQRRDQPTLWGYYQVKFAWLVSSATLLILFGETTGWLSRVGQRLWRGNGVVFASAVVLGAMHLLTPVGTAQSPFTPVALVRTHQRDPAAQAIFKILRTHPKTFVVGYSLDPALGQDRDAFINLWLFQASAHEATDPIRRWAYYLDPTDPRSACEAVTVWGPGVQLRTRSQAVVAGFRHACPAERDAVRFFGRSGPARPPAGAP